MHFSQFDSDSEIHDKNSHEITIPYDGVMQATERFYPKFTKYFRSLSDLDYGIVYEQSEGRYIARLEEEIRRLRTPTWKVLKDMMEAEAISKIEVSKALYNFICIARELAGDSESQPDDTTAILFHLILWKMEASGMTLVPDIMLRQVFGTVSAAVQHHLTVIMRDILDKLPDYTIRTLQKKLFLGRLRYGDGIPYTPLTRDTKRSWEVLEPFEDVPAPARCQELIPDTGVGQLQPSISKRPRMPLPYCRTDNHECEEVHICFKDTAKSVQEVERTSQGKPVDAFDRKLFPLLGLTAMNLLISLPVSSKKVPITVHAVEGLYGAYREEGAVVSARHKVVCLTSETEGAHQLAADLEGQLRSLQLIVRHFTANANFNRADFIDTHVMVSTYRKWELFTRSPAATMVTNLVRLIVIDDLSSLENSDGPYLEAVITRMKLQDLAGFLQVNPNGIVLHSEAFSITRSVSLVQMKGDANTLPACLHAVSDALARNMQAIVFVRDTLDAVQTMQALLLLAGKQRDDTAPLPSNVNGVSYRKMQERGFAVLHPDTVLEDNFLRNYKVLIVPIRRLWEIRPHPCCVVIKETDSYEDKHGILTDVTRSTLTRMMAVSSSMAACVTVVVRCNLDWYLGWLHEPGPIRSSLEGRLVDMLNVQIVLGTVRSMGDAVHWFKSTYLYTRLRRQAEEATQLDDEVAVRMESALVTLRKAGMVHLVSPSLFMPTELGLVGCQCDIPHVTIAFLRKSQENGQLNPFSDAPIVNSSALIDTALQAPHFQSHPHYNTFKQSGKSLVEAWMMNDNDVHRRLCTRQAVVVKNVANVMRAMFLMALHLKKSGMASACLHLTKRLEEKPCANDAGDMVAPFKVRTHVRPRDKSLMLVTLHLTPNFKWRSCHVMRELFWLWIEDNENDFIVVYRQLFISKRQVVTGTCLEVTIPVCLPDILRQQYSLHVEADKLPVCNMKHPIDVSCMTLPQDETSFTDFKDLQPLPVSSLNDTSLEKLYSRQHWDPLVGEVFFSLYHDGANVLLAGHVLDVQRTIAAELAIFQALRSLPGCKVIYTAPCERQVERRYQYWKSRLPWTVGMLTGKWADDAGTLDGGSVVLSTRDHWEAATRDRPAGKVSLLIIDDMDIMDTALEVIMARMASSSRNTRLVSLSSCALANADDIAVFLHRKSLLPFVTYHFRRPSRRRSVLPHVSVHGFPQACHASRMAVMNPFLWELIGERCPPGHPAVVIVPSRRQLLLTAEAFLNYLLASGNPKKWLNATGEWIPKVKDVFVRFFLTYGIGISHTGMSTEDRRMVQELLEKQIIQVVVVTVNVARTAAFTSHLVLLKGTQRYSEDVEMFEEYSPEEMHRMLTPSHTSCPACRLADFHSAAVLTESANVAAYEALFHGAVCVESMLPVQLTDVLCREVALGRVTGVMQAQQLVGATFLATRLACNPSYYVQGQCAEQHVRSLVRTSLQALVRNGCADSDAELRTLQPTSLGKMVAKYNVCQDTLTMFHNKMGSHLSTRNVLAGLCHSWEIRRMAIEFPPIYSTGAMDGHCRWKVDNLNPPSVRRAFRLLQVYLSLRPSVLQPFAVYALKLMQVMGIINIQKGRLLCTISSQLLLRMLLTGSWCPLSSPLHVALGPGRCELKDLFQVKALQDRDTCSLGRVLRKHPKLSCVDQTHTHACGRAPELVPTLKVRLSIYVQGSGWRDLGSAHSTSHEVVLHAGQRYVLNAAVRANRMSSWTVVLGHAGTDTVLALRWFHDTCSNVHLAFTAHSTPGPVTYVLFVSSNSFLGLDRVYSMSFVVVDERTCQDDSTTVTA